MRAPIHSSLPCVYDTNLDNVIGAIDSTQYTVKGMTLENNIMPYAVVNVVLSISQRSNLLNSLGFEFVVHSSSLTLTGATAIRPLQLQKHRQHRNCKFVR